MQAGGRDRFRDAPTRQIGTSDSRFPSLFDVGRETSRAATHVDACDEVLSDAGATPAASKSAIYFCLNDLTGRLAESRRPHYKTAYRLGVFLTMATAAKHTPRVVCGLAPCL